MTYKLHMNGVITGSLNSFCLACDSFLKSQQEATEHIETSEHKKKLNAVLYSDKFKDEHIKKFKGGYYCEFCNILLPIASKVNLHVTEEEHKRNKGILLLKPMGGDVIAFNDILIGENAWHGLIEGVCSLCNVEFEEENDHKTDASHSLNLVLKPIQFGEDYAIYRHLDDTAVQCLTCNKLLAPCRMTKHFEDTEHHELYAKRRIERNGVCQETETKGDSQVKETNLTSIKEKDNEIKKSKMDNEIKKSKIDNDGNNNNKSPAEDKSKILESIVKYQSKGININLETETAFCKKCSKVITFEFMEIEDHIESHSSAVTVDSDLLYPSNPDPNLNRVNLNDKTTQSSDAMKDTDIENDFIKEWEAHSNERESEESNEKEHDSDVIDLIPPVTNKNDEKCSQDEAKDFAKANTITYNEDNNRSYCRICGVHLPASFKSMKEHVAGAQHKREASQHKRVASSVNQVPNPGSQSKQETRDFVDSAYDVENLFSKATIINEEYCVPYSSFHLISGNNLRLRCIICEVNLPPFSDMDDHLKTRQHNLKFLRVPFITSEKNEFIREVRPGLYHCGYCNLVVSGWSDMKLHLNCSDHLGSRHAGENRLRHNLPELQRFKMRRELQALSLMRFFNMF